MGPKWCSFLFIILNQEADQNKALHKDPNNRAYNPYIHALMFSIWSHLISASSIIV